MEQRKRIEALVILMKTVLAGLAAKVDAPPFPSVDASTADVEDWTLDVLRRLSMRIAEPDDPYFEVMHLTAMANLGALGRKVGVAPLGAEAHTLEDGQGWIIAVMAATALKMKAAEHPLVRVPTFTAADVSLLDWFRPLVGSEDWDSALALDDLKKRVSEAVG